MKSDANANLNSFGNTASKLSQNPLGIIALFIVLVYAFASLVVALGKNLTEGAASILVWFMVLFPVLVLSVFAWLVSRHHTKLYAPRDYQKEEHFIEVLSHEVVNLKPVQPQLPGSRTPTELSGNTETSSMIAEAREGSAAPEQITKHSSELILERISEREKIYGESRMIVLVHKLTPSNKTGFKYDISIYAKRHGDKDISDVAKAEFFFGKSWGYQTFTGEREGNVIGVSTSAYGTFLCTCWITFTDGQRASIYRYIDFEMGELVQKVLQKSTAT